MRRWSLAVLAVVMVLSAAVLAGHVAWLDARAADEPVVHQKNRTFLPARLTIARNTIVRFLNDESIIHHAYVTTPDFSVDSGDILPGAQAPLLFDREGRFLVRCAIHPNMRVEVVVNP